MNYLWEIPDEYPEKFLGEYLREESPEEFLFRQGKHISPEFGSPSFKFKGASRVLSTYDVLSNSTAIPLVSERLGHALAELAKADVQLIPANIKTHDGLLSGYNLVNVLSLSPCIDYGESDFIYIPGTKRIMKFNRLGLKPNALGNHHLARDEEYRSSFLFVSEALKRAFEQNKFKGCSIVGPETIKP